MSSLSPIRLPLCCTALISLPLLPTVSGSPPVCSLLPSRRPSADKKRCSTTHFKGATTALSRLGTAAGWDSETPEQPIKPGHGSLLILTVDQYTVCVCRLVCVRACVVNKDESACSLSSEGLLNFPLEFFLLFFFLLNTRTPLRRFQVSFVSPR